jgi:hypothetical protein
MSFGLVSFTLYDLILFQEDMHVCIFSSDPTLRMYICIVLPIISISEVWKVSSARVLQ